MYTSTSAYGGVSSNANSRCDNNSYRIGQNCIISSGYEEPRMAEIASLNTMKIGATSVYEECYGPNITIKRAGEDDHQGDPMQDPIGSPLLALLLFAVVYAFFRKRKKA